MKLYEIAEELRALDAKVRDGIDWDEETGEVIDLGAALDDVQMSWEDKVENCLMLRSEWTAEAKAIKDEADRLAKRAKAMENNAEGLREYVSACLVASGRDSIKTKTHSVRMQNYESVFVDDVESLPRELTKIEVRADKREIKKLLKAGQEVHGAHIVVNRKAVIR